MSKKLEDVIKETGKIVFETENPRIAGKQIKTLLDACQKEGVSDPTGFGSPCRIQLIHMQRRVNGLKANYG